MPAVGGSRQRGQLPRNSRASRASLLISHTTVQQKGQCSIIPHYSLVQLLAIGAQPLLLAHEAPHAPWTSLLPSSHILIPSNEPASGLTATQVSPQSPGTPPSPHIENLFMTLTSPAIPYRSRRCFRPPPLHLPPSPRPHRLLHRPRQRSPHPHDMEHPVHSHRCRLTRYPCLSWCRKAA